MALTARIFQGPQGAHGQAFGWRRWADATYTDGSPLALAGGVRTLLSNDGLGATSENRLVTPFEDHPFFDGSQVTAWALGDAYVMRWRFFGRSGVINNNLEIDLSLGGAPRSFLADRKPFDSNAGVDFPFYFQFQTLVGAAFVTNGLRCYLTAEQDAEIYGGVFTVMPLFTP